MREQPFCVVLLDEIEKAHPDVFDALLSALGEGRLTDANGRTADFRNAIVVMTSNLGAGQRDSSALGFSASDAAVESERLRRHFVEQAEKFFRPEFFNRIDRVLAFRSLDPEIVRRIARRELGRLLMREGITRRRLLVEIDDAVVDGPGRARLPPPLRSAAAAARDRARRDQPARAADRRAAARPGRSRALHARGRRDLRLRPEG